MECSGLEMKALQISFGLTSNKSFKVLGKLGGTKVVILIDIGATSNFISKSLAQQLMLTVTSTPEYTMEVGTG